MIMAQDEYEKIVKAMYDKGVPHWAFELLADLRHNEVMNSRAIDGIESAVAGAKRKQGDGMMEERELACMNEKCRYNDHTFDQNCAAMIGERELPYLPYCQKYIAEGVNEI